MIDKNRKEKLKQIKWNKFKSVSLKKNWKEMRKLEI